ncbi:MAG: hypothetical protein HY552_04185 [Elusimicrobia bacterium]|nr:hypothetical protein [Elusimicrobiota bacterium]
MARELFVDVVVGAWAATLPMAAAASIVGAAGVFGNAPMRAPVIVTTLALDMTGDALELNAVDALRNAPDNAPLLVAAALREHAAELPAGRAVVVHDMRAVGVFPSGRRALFVPLDRNSGPANLKAARIVESLQSVAGHAASLVARPHAGPANAAALHALTDAFYDLRASAEASDASAEELVPDDLDAQMRTRWIRDREYDALLQNHRQTRGPLLGRLPAELADALGPSRPTDAAVRAIASVLRAGIRTNSDGNVLRESAQTAAEAASRVAPGVRVFYADSGSKGDVYRLEAGGRSFALKIYRQGSAQDEFRALTFFEAMGARDSMRSHAAGIFDPQAPQAATWLLSEWIDPRRALTLEDWLARGSRWMHDIAEEYGVYVKFSHDRIQGILVDLGDAVHKDDASLVTPSEFRLSTAYLKGGLVRFIAPWKHLLLPPSGEQPRPPR